MKQQTTQKKTLKMLALILMMSLSLVWLAGCGSDDADVKESGEPGITQEEPSGSQEEPADSQEEPAGGDPGTTGSDSGSSPSNEGTGSGSSGSGNTGSNSNSGSETGTGTSTKPGTTTPASTCTIKIDCSLLVGKDLSGTGLETLVPDDGIILGTTKVTVEPGDTVYDLTLRVTQAKKIHMATEGSEAMGNLYVAAISNIYEKAYNSKSGWVYLINGEKPGVGSGVKELKAGDVLVWAYSLNLGNDL